MAEILTTMLSHKQISENLVVDGEFVSGDIVGRGLIELYFRTDDLETRTMITEFMRHAGYQWLRRLITRDADPIAA